MTPRHGSFDDGSGPSALAVSSTENPEFGGKKKVSFRPRFKPRNV
jgi:hypothetical protein